MPNLKDIMLINSILKRALAGKTAKEIKEAVEETSEDKSILHSLAQNVNDFLISITAGRFVAKTLNETRSILNLTLTDEQNSDYTASFGDAVLCGGRINITFPEVTDDDINNGFSIINKETTRTYGLLNASTIYGCNTVVVNPRSTLSFKAISTDEWILN